MFVVGREERLHQQAFPGRLRSVMAFSVGWMSVWCINAREIRSRGVVCINLEKVNDLCGGIPPVLVNELRSIRV